MDNHTIGQNTNYQNELANKQPIVNGINDEELLISYIGKNNEKIMNKPFNFAGFFFSTLYMFYRKMFLYGIILFSTNAIVLVALNAVGCFWVTILFNLAVGLFVNKMYILFAKKNIEKIKLKNSRKNLSEIREICSSKGGTSIGKLFLGLFIAIVISFIIILIMFIIGFVIFFFQLI